MTRPTARVLALLELLQSGGTRTVKDLAEKLEVDERTVRRYIEHLTDLDIPVRTVRGRYGGYHLAQGFRMPPLMLTDDEAAAVLLGLVAGSRTGLVTETKATESATAKLRRVLPEKLARKMDALLATAEFTAAARQTAAPETAVLLTLAEAARDRHPVKITYTAWKKNRSERTLNPYGIVAHSGRWYVTGADSVSNEVRNFRLDRIESATPQQGTFTVPPGFDPTHRVLTGLAEVPYQHEVSVRIKAKREEIRLPPGVATMEDLNNDWVRVKLRAQRLEWVPSALAGLNHEFVIEYPDALREHVHALARRLTAYADADGPE